MCWGRVKLRDVVSEKPVDSRAGLLLDGVIDAFSGEVKHREELTDGASYVPVSGIGLSLTP